MKRILVFLLLVTSLIANAQVPNLNSSPGTPAVIFLDFDGHTVNNGLWNNGNTINCANPNLSTAMITEAFERVAEDYKIFKLNVTTDSTVFLAAPYTQRVRIIITPTNFIGTGTGGIAYMNSFVWGDDTPAFVFTDPNATAKFIGEASSHEAGHSLGCAHQSIYDIYCNKINEYNSGQGDGEVAWAPIMGFSVDRGFSTWHDGKKSTSCDNQDDVTTISNRITGGGLIVDDVANTTIDASLLPVTVDIINTTNIINNNTDIDVFKINITEASVLKLNIAPPVNVYNQNMGNVDVMAKLINGAGTVIATYNILDSLNARIDTTLATGTYYLSIEGTSNINAPSDYGSAGTFSIKGTLQTVLSLPIYNIAIRGTVTNGNHVIQWNITADEPIAKTIIEYSTDGASFTGLQQVDYRATSFSYKPFTSSTIYYRVKATTQNGVYKLSNVVAIQSIKLSDMVQLLNNKVNDQLLVTVKENCNYQLMDLNGKVVAKGALFTNKLNTIAMQNVTTGMYILKAFTPITTIAHKIIKE